MADESMRGAFEQLDGRADLHHFAKLHHHHLIGKGQRLGLVVGDVDHRRLNPLVQLLQLAPQLPLQMRVDHRQWFVEHHDVDILAHQAAAHERSGGRDEVQAFYGCPVEFGAQASRFVFRPEDLELPLAGADRVLLRLLRSYGDQLLEGQARGRKNTGLAAQVEDAVSARLSGGSATLANVAADLGMSPRTLSRKLAQTGTSYFTILEELRKALAIRYLRESGLALAEIAFLLGYSGLNSFSDAFRRWTGQSPGQFRGK